MIYISHRVMVNKEFGDISIGGFVVVGLRDIIIYDPTIATEDAGGENWESLR